MSGTGTEEYAYRRRDALAVCDVTARQLDYWVEQGLVSPRTTRATGRPHRRYSFRQLVLIRAISQLRTAGVGVAEIKAAASHLEDGEDLANAWLVVAGGTVYRHGGNATLEAIGAGHAQLAFAVVVLHEIESEVNEALVEDRGDGSESPASTG